MKGKRRRSISEHPVRVEAPEGMGFVLARSGRSPDDGVIINREP
jgi:hypothetical protein